MEDFTQLAEPYRRELTAHCYRMLGSIHDAEDLVQETYLRAWRAYDRFEGRSSLRTWLYSIATSACLRALENRDRRPLPSGLGGPSEHPERRPELPPHDIRWLQPIPDTMLDGISSDPAELVAWKESTRLAMITALQQLRPRQRAVLILRDVLRFRAAEVADLLGTTASAVNSILLRARSRIERLLPAEIEDVPADLDDPRLRALLDEFVAAFENADASGLAKLLRDDAELEMPPFLTWFAGADNIVRFLETHAFAGTRDAIRMFPTAANGAPAFASYRRAQDGRLHAHAIHVLILDEFRIGRITAFHDPGLFSTFGLPDQRAG